MATFLGVSGNFFNKVHREDFVSRSNILFVAGDGASGRIMAEVGESIGKERDQLHIIQAGAGAEALYRLEGRGGFVLSQDSPDVPKVIDSIISDYALVVVGHSGTAWQIEDLVARAAFSRKISVLKVFDHILGTGHAYLRSLIDDWMKESRPPFIVTATTDAHIAEIVRLYPVLNDFILKVGNPLHIKLERLMEDGAAGARLRLRGDFRLPIKGTVVSVFLSGNNDDQFVEMLSMTDALAIELAKKDYSGMALDVHFVNDDWEDVVAKRVETWRAIGVKVSTRIPQDSMIALCDALFASPTSTTCERALANDIPVIQSYGKAEEAAMSGMTPEIESGAVLLAKDEPGEWVSLLVNAFDPALRAKRRAAVEACGAVPERGAMERLRHAILRLSLS
jgi:hypothetical protein